ncbi:MAG: hypothetical protein KC435_14305, partial [Thermomicrobiales bacterium]|nr:hypothetical protein [Thermomicrobiales bacterium]
STPSNPADYTGVVTGTIIVTDGDGDTTVFTIDGGTSTGANSFTTLGGGTLVIDPTAGTYTFTPSNAQRLAASHINATADDTSETITIIVDDGHGGTTSESITTAITAITVPGNSPGFGINTQYSNFGTDGTAYLYTARYNSGNYSYDFAIITPTGTAVTTPLVGIPNYDVLLGPDDTAYVYTDTIDTTPERYYLTMISKSGTTTGPVQLPGARQSVLIGPDGTAYQVTIFHDPYTGDATYHLSNITTTGVITTATLPYSPALDPQFQLGPDGTAYLALTDQNSGSGETTYYLATVTTTGLVTTTQVLTAPNTHLTGDLQIGPDGTAYLFSYQIVDDPDPGTPSEIHQLTALTSTGTTISALPGIPVGTVQFGADGTGYQTVRVYDTVTGTDSTHLIGLTAGNATTVAVLEGTPAHAVQIGSNGTVFVTTYTDADDTTHLTAVAPGEPATVIAALPGRAVSSLSFLPDGTVHLVTSEYDPAVLYDSTAYRFNYVTLAGTVTSVALPGEPSADVVFGDDGTAYLLSRAHLPDPHLPANVFLPFDYVTVITPTGTATNIQLPGLDIYELRLRAGGPGGPVYATTSTSEPNNYVTYVTAIGADGTATTTTIQGMAIGAVQIGPDGTAYQTTLDYWSLPTYVTAISPTGTTTTFTIDDGRPVGTVQFDPDGTVSQIVTGLGSTRLVVL